MNKTGLLILGIALTTALAAAAEKAEHHSHRHHASVFLGGTHDYQDQNAFTAGVDYEFRLTGLLGAGALIDYAGGDIESTVIGGGLFFHPWHDLRLLTAVGKEIHHGHNEFLVRLGFMYDFHLEGWTLSPTISIDLLESGHQNLIYGFGIGKSF